MNLRDAVPDDALDVARVHVRAWQQGFAGILPDNFLASLEPESRAKRYTFGIADGTRPQTIVALERDRLLGFATTHVQDGEALLVALYVDPDAWGTGVGRALVKEARKELAKTGKPTAMLWSLVGNTRADRFYLADGWALDGGRRTEDVWGTVMEQQRYRRAL
ncbi:MAG TPA: GNAT family N-acetyltransferase [Kofleriaceae bacterium]